MGDVVVADLETFLGLGFVGPHRVRQPPGRNGRRRVVGEGLHLGQER